MTTDNREQGIAFGAFGDRIRDQGYPTTADELVAEHGDLVLTLAGGETTVEQVLGGADEEYADAEAVRQSVFNRVGGDAVGRKRYTDRDPPTPGEGGVGTDESL